MTNEELIEHITLIKGCCLGDEYEHTTIIKGVRKSSVIFVLDKVIEVLEENNGKKKTI